MKDTEKDPVAHVRYRGKKTWVANVNKDFWEDTRLSMNARVFWVSVYMYWSPNSTHPWVSLSRLAKTMLRDRKTLRLHRQELVDKGYMRISYGNKRNKVYYDLTEEPHQFEPVDDDAPDDNGSEEWVGSGSPGGVGSHSPGGRGAVPQGGRGATPQGVGNPVPHSAAQSDTSGRKTKGETRGPSHPKSPSKTSHKKTTTKSASRGSATPSSSGPSDLPPSAEDEDKPTPAESAEELPSGEDSPDVKANNVLMNISDVIRASTGKAPSIGQNFRMQALEFFQLNEWSSPVGEPYVPHDIYYICSEGCVRAQQNPAPEAPRGSSKPAFDPYFYCRRYAATPNRIFTEDNQGDLILLKMKQEIGYDQPLSFDEINEHLLALVRARKALKALKA